MVWGPSRGTCTDVEVRKLKRGELAQWNDTARAAGGWGVRLEGGVLMICDEPLARWWGSGEGLARSGLVHIGFAGGHFEMRRFAVGGLGGWRGCHGVVTSGAKHGGTEADALRRFLQISGRGGTGWDG